MLPRTVAPSQFVTYKTLVGTIAVVAVALSSIITALVLWYVNSHIPVQVASHVAPIDKRVARMEGLLEGLLKNVTTGNPDEVKRKLVLARGYLDAAKTNHFIVSPDLVKTSGIEVVNFDSPDPNVKIISWATATKFVEYRSFLNAKLYPTGRASGVGSGAPVIRVGPPCCHQVKDTIIELGGPYALDWVEWDGVLFANTIIRYSGNPMRLKNVHFENCTFEIADTPAGRRFSLALLASPSVAIDLDRL